MRKGWVSPLVKNWTLLREPVKNYLADFFPLRGYPPPPPPTPLTENHFAIKPLSERGGTPPPSKIAEKIAAF